MKHCKTAILIFAYSAEKEATLKPFQHSKRVFDALNVQTQDIAKKSGFPYVVFSEKQQKGNSFGERFTHAIQSVYNKGYDTVITIGNDTPHLTTNHILKTAHHLQNHDMVLGPSIDGGFYIMGLKKSQFNTKTFLELPWQTSQLNRSISQLHTSKKLKAYYLEVLSDIDSASDINTIIHSFRGISNTIKQLLISTTSIEKKIISNLNISIENFILNQPPNKGSPVAALII
ncbi:DUF2064 domain-containing protein [Tamlana sp. 2201CG12-4]|uniref:DUF2064 domain-containing protein n=1 Tax=Tamlana sp. 2201CG12-4 TaxID=3112582 RepID=UPI002DBA094B|nr:DUF2064 domain-containing protein [Tamlana sp. 2201CG12-4]MEC3906825.1 DUF2064 domain-containing protein [Tamlana sp. 2201CG12-4]